MTDSRFNVLLAEDDAVSRVLMRKILSTDPRFETQTVSDGAAAWKLMQSQQPFDVYVFDLVMPRCSGMDLLVRARDDRRLAQVPVVLCSAVNDRETISRAAALGVRHYILKPVTRDDVLTKVIAAVESKGRREEIEPTASVCARLGVSSPTLVELRQQFSESLLRWLSECRTVVRAGELAPMMVRANALRGSALSLGAASLAKELIAGEASFREILHRETVRAPFLSRSDFDEIERVSERIGSELGRLAA